MNAIRGLLNKVGATINYSARTVDCFFGDKKAMHDPLSTNVSQEFKMSKVAWYRSKTLPRLARVLE